MDFSLYCHKNLASRVGVDLELVLTYLSLSKLNNLTRTFPPSLRIVCHLPCAVGNLKPSRHLVKCTHFTKTFNLI